jgi:hypothetical protein
MIVERTISVNAIRDGTPNPVASAGTARHSVTPPWPKGSFGPKTAVTLTWAGAIPIDQASGAAQGEGSTPGSGPEPPFHSSPNS